LFLNELQLPQAPHDQIARIWARIVCLLIRALFLHRNHFSVYAALTLEAPMNRARIDDARSGRPNPRQRGDLRQMYVYHEYYGASKVALIYPGKETYKSNGNYLDPISRQETQMECSVITFLVEPKIKQWQRKIQSELESWWISTVKNTE
jgi:hypothetical protein